VAWGHSIWGTAHPVIPFILLPPTMSFSVVRGFSPALRLAPFRASFSLRHSSTVVPRTLPAFSMQGKVCMVTGAARGLGNEFCKAFIESGCTSLAILDLKEEEAKNAAQELVTNFAVVKLPQRV
jgi:hypothetical protein